jgi:hypothetical protein
MKKIETILLNAKNNNKFKSEFIVITPELAATLLKLEVNNRTSSSNHVSSYAKSMKEGSWKTTHEGIAFNNKGELVDGGHRLRAIIEANVSVTMLVTWDLDEDAINFVNNGRPRNHTDALEFAGISLEKRKDLMAFARGCAYMLLHEKNNYGGITQAGAQVKNDEIVNFVKNNLTELKESFDELQELFKTSKDVRINQLFAVYQIAKKENPLKMYKFLEIVSGRIETTEKCPANAYKLRMEKNSKTHSNKRMKTKESYFLLVDAVNKFLNDSKTDKIDGKMIDTTIKVSNKIF